MIIKIITVAWIHKNGPREKNVVALNMSNIFMEILAQWIEYYRFKSSLMNFSKLMTNLMKMMITPMMMNHLMIIPMKMMRVMVMIMIKSKLKNCSIQSPSFCFSQITNTGRSDGLENLNCETLRKFYKQAKPFKFSNLIL